MQGWDQIVTHTESEKKVGIGTTSKESRQCHNTPICKKLALSFRTQLMVNQTFLT